jgi:hypothetical protein
MYNPAQGRFLSRDSLPPGSPDILFQHPFAYAGNNPAKWTDASGLSCGDPPATPKQRTEKECCAALLAELAVEEKHPEVPLPNRKWGIAPNVAGVNICCDGRPVACLTRKPLSEAEKRVFPEGTIIRAIEDKCSLLHEGIHVKEDPKWHKFPCPANIPNLSPWPYLDFESQKKAECIANAASFKCIMQAVIDLGNTQDDVKAGKLLCKDFAGNVKSVIGRYGCKESDLIPIDKTKAAFDAKCAQFGK